MLKKCIYAFGGKDNLFLPSEEEMLKNGASPEEQIVIRHFCYFGPASEGLFRLVDDEKWCTVLREVSEQAQELVKENPDWRFEQWGEGLGTEGLDLISGMTNPDPTARPTIDQVLSHPWWQQAIQD